MFWGPRMILYGFWKHTYWRKGFVFFSPFVLRTQILPILFLWYFLLRSKWGRLHALGMVHYIVCALPMPIMLQRSSPPSSSWWWWIIVMITVAFWWWKGEHDNVFTLARAIMLQQQPPPTAPFIRHSLDFIHICSVRISDDGHGFLLAIGRDAKMRFGCIIEQKWMHVPDADADARSGCTCTSAPKFVSPGWPALVHLALCVLKWERGIKVINTFPPNHSSKAEPTQTLLSFNPT